MTSYIAPVQQPGDASQMRAFFREMAHRPTVETPDGDASYADWHAWSVRERAEFWGALWQAMNVVADRRADGQLWDAVLRGGDRMSPPDTQHGPHWFPGATLNFAENLLRRRDDAPAVISRAEGAPRREITFAELHRRAAQFAAALVREGVQPGDRVAGYLPNIPETIIAALGTAWIGAVWSSCSPDFGVSGVVDRFGQIEPKVLVVADGYRYAGKSIDCLARVEDIIASISSVQKVVVVPFLRTSPDFARLRDSVAWADWLDREPGEPPPFARMPFQSPLYVMFSSGTTGLPKCMVHGVGGTLLQHLKEHALHCDLRRDERLFYVTTCGWMMWNWMLTALALGVTVVLYDGAPMHPAPAALWDVVSDEWVNVFGTSAKFLALTEKAGARPVRTHDLAALRLILSTGSPLAPASYDYVERDVKSGVHLASISGGTDLISCFALGNPLSPVRRGELQGPGLAMAVDVYDEDGNPVRGVPGELVCTKPFPSMPVAFWNDPDGEQYRTAYFDFYPGVWRHGDWAEITEAGGVIIYGRADATLNPGGVRIGTAEIYRQVEQIPEVIESVVIAQNMPPADTRVVLFVRLREGVVLDDQLRARIVQRIRDQTSPHHVPKLILQVNDIPRTISGKITELAVREAFHGRRVNNTAAMANPESLAEFRALGETHRV